jgi:hypothetical protein
MAALPGSLRSQNYSSLFGNTSTTWDMILFGACDAICSQTVTVTGDTTIDSKTYKIISGLPGFVREDTVQGKAWFYDTSSNTEYLVMDLSLNLGDTFNIYTYNNVAYPFVVDSVYFAGSLKHVRLIALTVMCAFSEKITFIEGSGTTAGLNYQRKLNGSSVNSYMLCQHKDGVKVTGNSLFNDLCFICDVGMDDHRNDANAIKVYPDPAVDMLSIEIKNLPPGDFDLKIYNFAGELFYSQKISKQLTAVDVSQLSGGLYFVVAGNGTSNWHQKFFKR